MARENFIIMKVAFTKAIGKTIGCMGKVNYTTRMGHWHMMGNGKLTNSMAMVKCIMTIRLCWMILLITRILIIWKISGSIIRGNLRMMRSGGKG